MVGEREERLLEDQQSGDLRPRYKIFLEERDAELVCSSPDCHLLAKAKTLWIVAGHPYSSQWVQVHIDWNTLLAVATLTCGVCLIYSRLRFAVSALLSQNGIMAVQRSLSFLQSLLQSHHANDIRIAVTELASIVFLIV